MREFKENTWRTTAFSWAIIENIDTLRVFRDDTTTIFSFDWIDCFETGGSPLYLEAVLAEKVEKPEGSVGIEITGHLGDVMKESVKIALTVSRNFLARKEPDNKFLHQNRIHLHFPEVSVHSVSKR